MKGLNRVTNYFYTPPDIPSNTNMSKVAYNVCPKFKQKHN